MPSNLEKRTAQRAEMNSDAVVYLGGEQIPCRTLNVSRHGIALSSPVRRMMDSPLRVEFLVPEGYGWVKARASLVRDARYYGAFVWGVVFSDLDELSKNLLEEYVEDNLPYDAFA